MFTTLIKVLKEQADRGIYHTRKNGELVQKLFTKDADLVYEVTDPTSHYHGEKYAFFIIEAEDGDKVRYCDWDHNLEKDYYFDKYKMYWDYCKITEMCKELLRQSKPIPYKMDDLLGNKLLTFFNRIIDEEDLEFDRKTIWENYKLIRDYMGKKAYDYVSQTTIDKFLTKYAAYILI